MNQRPVRRTGIWLLVGVSYLASAAFVGWRFVRPSDGAPISYYAGAWSNDGIRVDPMAGADTQLQSGDLVLAIDGQPLSRWLVESADPGIPRVDAVSGAALTYTLERNASEIDLQVTLLTRDLSGLLIDNWANIVFGAVLLAVALYVLRRRPEASASVALAVAATGAGASVTPWLLGLAVSDIYFGWPFLLQTITVNAIYMLLWPAGALHLPLAMAPATSGLPRPSRRVLGVVYGLPLGGYAAGLLASLLISPSLTAWLGTWPTLQGLVTIPCVLVGIGLAVISYRRSHSELKRQVRWAVVGGVAATSVGLALLYVPQLITGKPLVSWTVVGLTALPMPVGLAFAIVRHRLFDIEVVVNRTLVYGGLTLAIVAIYAATVLVLGALLPGTGSFPSSLLATGFAALAALPIRDVLQRSVNRLMYGDRDDPYRALARLAGRLEATIEPLAIPGAIVESVVEALRVPYVALEIGPPAAVELTASRGTPTHEPRQIPLVYGSETVGRLLISPRAPSEAFSASDLRLLDDLARSAGAAVHSVRLTLDIVRARERTVGAREEERRRIRRDLHDGLGPSLAAIGMRVELAADLAGRDPPAAEQTLQQLSTEVRAAVGEIRRLVEGLRPPSLDERGLVGAIQAQAERLGPEPVFDVSTAVALPDLPAAVEVAAYRIAVEAMTNAARHAGARECRVVVSVSAEGPPELRLEISDDGSGLSADARPGIGLISMRERAAEVGGSVEISGRSPSGTTVTAHLPLTAAATA